MFSQEKQILYISRYMWNLEKWYRWTYFQGRNRDADTENRYVDTAVKGWGGNWEIGIDIKTSPCVKQRASGNLLCDTGSSAHSSVIT